MYYLVYLALVGALLLLGASFSVAGGWISLDLSNIINFTDVWSALFVLAVVAAALLGTRSWRHFGAAVGFMFGKAPQSPANSLLAVKTAIAVALIAGPLNCIMQVVNVISRMDLTAETAAASLGPLVSVGMLSLFYGLVAALLLLPMYVALRQTLNNKATEEKIRQFPPAKKQKKHKKAS